MKKKQLATMGVALGLVGAIGVGGTLAILTQKTKEVTNTFTVGKGFTDESSVTLTETKVEGDGEGNYVKVANGEQVNANSYPDVIPNSNLAKDPTVYVKTSEVPENFYMFVQITGLKGLLDGGLSLTEWGDKWDLVQVEGEEPKQTISVDNNITEGSSSTNFADGNIFAYCFNAEAENDQYVIKSSGIVNGKLESVFDGLKAGDKVTLETTQEDHKVIVQACAVAADNVDFDVAYQEASNMFQASALTEE